MAWVQNFYHTELLLHMCVCVSMWVCMCEYVGQCAHMCAQAHAWATRHYHLSLPMFTTAWNQASHSPQALKGPSSQNDVLFPWAIARFPSFYSATFLESNLTLPGAMWPGQPLSSVCIEGWGIQLWTVAGPALFSLLPLPPMRLRPGPQGRGSAQLTAMSSTFQFKI